jgi:hypothetical protein
MKWSDHREPWIKGGPEWVERYSIGEQLAPLNPVLQLYQGQDQRYSMFRN